jgi:hypothetical protein
MKIGATPTPPRGPYIQLVLLDSAVSRIKTIKPNFDKLRYGSLLYQPKGNGGGPQGTTGQRSPITKQI